MDLGLSSDQEAIRDIFGSFFADRAGLDQARAAQPLGFDPEGWARLGETGAAGNGWIDYDARHAPVTTIYGGTTEINRNNVAERHLGLPRTR